MQSWKKKQELIQLKTNTLELHNAMTKKCKMKNALKIQGNVAVIELTQGLSMLVMVETLPVIAPYRWYASRDGKTHYAITNVRQNGHWTTLKVHRLLCGLDFGDKRQVDHIDGNGLNNTSANLRVTDAAGNLYNQHGKRQWTDGTPPTSHFAGVYWDKGADKWRAKIRLAGLQIHLGLYDNETKAATAYESAKAVRDAGGTRREIVATRLKEV
jgi:hypothetical protein